MKKRIYELPTVEPRESEYSLDWVIGKLSALNTQHLPDFERNDLMEMILMLANKIKKLEIANTFLSGCIQAGLKPDESRGAFLALEQMMSKGKLTDEEKEITKL